MPRLTFENCVSISYTPEEKNAVAGNEFFNVEFVVKRGRDKFASFHCNKFSLSAASPVFQKQFFGSLKRKQEDENEEETTEVIQVEDASFVAFKIFLQLLFHDEKNAIPLFSTQCGFRVLFEVLKLADKYIIDDAMNMVIKRIEAQDISKVNIVEAVSLTTEFGNLLPFESVCASLMTRCCERVAILWPTTKDFLNFCATKKDQMCHLNLLFTKAAEVDSMALKACNNCRSDYCLDGKQVEDAWEGLKVLVTQSYALNKNDCNCYGKYAEVCSTVMKYSQQFRVHCCGRPYYVRLAVMAENLNNLEILYFPDLKGVYYKCK